uniref:Secreted frizzled-related protein 2-like n=1 Tax=Dermatophagoides pteronyssinus TaxID=6956 RepID=A0A6P6YIQ5_DERPT|nr:secreted frizzled-related protein 2-like [Dermatophagoides pteronyssinus]
MISTTTIILLSLLAIMLANNSMANTFIWDPNNTDNIELIRSPFSRSHQTFANPPKCVPIPANLTLCNGIKYQQMRLPNLLLHETINEIIEQSSSWLQLLRIGCHPDTKLFLCSLFSPVCLDQTIPPCRSLCENVRRNCEPSMLVHGYQWPPMMQCNLFPIENNMCIESQQQQQQTTTTTDKSINHNVGQSSIRGNNNNKINQSNNNRTEMEQFQRKLMNSICNSDWVIKIGLNQIRNNRIRVKKFKPIFGTLNVPLPFALNINKSMIIIDSNDDQNVESNITNRTLPNRIKSNREKFIIIGRGNDHPNDLQVILALSWQKNTAQIKKAIRKVKNNDGCKKFLMKISNSSQQSSSIHNVSIANNEQTRTTAKRNRNRNRKKNSNIARRE